MTHHKNFHHRDEADWDPDADEEHRREWLEGLLLGPTEQAERGLVVGDIWDVLAAMREDGARLLELVDGVDVVAGGPPCQGFSMAGRRQQDDERNSLPDAFLDFVEMVSPRAVVIENVVGINRAFKANGTGGSTPFVELADALEGTGDKYVVQRVEVNARHFGVAQSRPRMMLIALRKDVAEAVRAEVVPGVLRSKDVVEGKVQWTDRMLHPRPGGRYEGAQPWDADHGDLLDVPAISVLEDLQDVSHDAPPEALSTSEQEVHPLAKWLRGRCEGALPPNQKPRRHTARVVQRFALYQYLRDHGVNPGAVMGIGAQEQDVKVAARRVAEHLEAAGLDPYSMPEEPFRASEDTDLAHAIVRLRTKKHSQRALSPSEPAPTVLTLPDDHVHPTRPRTMTVREMARLQSFPDWFTFMGKETTGGPRRRFEVPQYSQVGNAVPPVMAWAVLAHVKSFLDEHDEQVAREFLATV